MGPFWGRWEGREAGPRPLILRVSTPRWGETPLDDAIRSGHGEVVAFLLGGGASFAAHAGKAGARGVVNASPEPVSNVAVSTAEDVATVGLLYLAYEFPLIAAGIAVLLLGLTIWLLIIARRIIDKLFGRRQEPPSA